LHQYRPYLTLSDAFKVFKFSINNDFFKNDIFNALSKNYTVSQILEKIKKIKPNIKIKLVDTPIMNQLSYHVDKNKLIKSGLRLNSDLQKDINQTLKLFSYLKN